MTCNINGVSLDSLDADYIKQNFKLSANGSSREIFILNNDWIAKVAKPDSNGCYQNKNENDVYTRVVSYSSMKEVEILNDIQKHCEYVLDDERKVRLAQSLECILAKVLYLSPDQEVLIMERCYDDYPYDSYDLEEPNIQLLINRFELFANDIESGASWMYNRDGDLKLVDYGCTDEIANDRTIWIEDFIEED